MDEFFQIGLIGFPVSHSASPKIFEKFFEQNQLKNWEYKLFELENLEQLDHLIIDNPNLIGFNVTVPHKINILPYLTSISPEAAAIGAVNTVKISRTDKGYFLEGHNTDYFGFEETLNLLPSIPKTAIILGNGGSAKSVKAVLLNRNIQFDVVSRRKDGSQFSYEELDRIDWNEIDLLINTTPVGMYPNVEKYLTIPYMKIGKKTMAIDLIYNPQETLFLKKLKSQGCICFNGSYMLQKQADKAWAIFNQT